MTGWAFGAGVALALALTASRPSVAQQVTPDAAGRQALQLAEQLSAQSEQLYSAKRYPEAVAAAARVVALREQVVGKNHHLVAAGLGNLADIYREMGDGARGVPLYTRAIEIWRQAPAKNRWYESYPAYGLALVYQAKGDHARAEPLAARALALTEQARGPSDPELAPILTALGAINRSLRNYPRALGFVERALAIREKTLPPDHPELAAAVSNQGEGYLSARDFARAEAAFRRSLAMRQKALGPNDPAVASDLDSLGRTFEAKGDYAQAEQYLEKALALEEKNGNPLASTMDALANVYALKGDSARAQKLLERSLKLDAANRPETVEYALALYNLANIRARQGDEGGALDLLQKGIDIWSKKGDPNDPRFANFANLLGLLAYRNGELPEAEKLFRTALAIREKGLEANSPETAATLTNLATLLFDKGDYAGAEPLSARALTIQRNARGADHPYVAHALSNLAMLAAVKGNAAQAMALLRQSLDASERHVVRVLSTGSEEQRRLFLAQSAYETSLAISMHTQGAPADPAARELALLTTLRRKGRLLDAMSDSSRVLRAHLADGERVVFDKLRSVRNQIAAQTLSGPPPGKNGEQHRQAIAALEEQADRLEANISSRSAAFRFASQGVTLSAVRGGLPAGSMLVEITKYAPYDLAGRLKRKSLPARYAAYTLAPDGAIGYADLGDAAAIDGLVGAWRAALADPGKDAKAVARQLDERVMRPLRALLRNTRSVVLAPDGALDLVPFAALVDEKGSYLVKDWSLSYVATGRELLRPAQREAPRSPPVVLAAPDFDAAGSSNPAAAASPRKGGDRAVDWSRARFSPLPGTEAEGRAVAAALGTQLFSHARATTQALANVHGPRVLHIATHGFFLQEAAPAKTSGRALELELDIASAKPPPVSLSANPLLRSGLAFAGANLHRAGDNGVVTALEASSLDLWGTKLVVLSACETGIGEVRSGEGVYGLHRAFALAGAEALLMSLWKVDDDATRELMSGYYAALTKGEGRADALRKKQLAMLATPATAHPYYWASFVQYGDRSPLGAASAVKSQARADTKGP